MLSPYEFIANCKFCKKKGREMSAYRKDKKGKLYFIDCPDCSISSGGHSSINKALKIWNEENV